MVVIAGLFLSLLERVATCPITQTAEILVFPSSQFRADPHGMKMESWRSMGSEGTVKCLWFTEDVLFTF